VQDLLEHYLLTFPDIPGFFSIEAMATWSFFLKAQTDLDITGDFFEIGVYKGRSAVLGALHLRPEEWCVLVDINPVPETIAMLESVRSKHNRFLHCYSTTLRQTEATEHFGKCRWVHVDGDHKGVSVSNDLDLAADLITEKGIICVDDFFSFRYPQLTAATYKFLFERQGEFQLLFAGANKGYICRSTLFKEYDGIIRRDFLSVIESLRLSVQLNRSSHSSDGGCFTISFREGERRLFGLDEDMRIPETPSDLVF
jgi:Methyltransferase domain